MNILFKTAGGRAKNQELGLGHIYRCIALSHYMKKHSIYFLVEDYGGVRDVLNDNQHMNLYRLKKNLGVKDELKKTLDLIKEKKIDILIIDRYKTKRRYVNGIKKFVKTIIISDLKTIDYNADLIVNGFIGFKNRIFINNYGSTCLLGPKYQLLNQKYEHKSIQKNKKYDLLITVGGFDDKRIIETICKEVVPYLDKFKVKIILGPVTIKSRTIQKLELQFKDNLDVILKTKDMKREISNCKFGICGGGITSYEFVSMGVPFAIICQYKHQLQTATYWQKNNVGLNLGLPNTQLRKKLQNLFQNILNDNIPLEPKMSIVDGLGARRVAKAIL